MHVHNATQCIMLASILSDKSSAIIAEMGDRLAAIDMGRKVGSCCAPFRGGGAGPPSNTMSLRPRPVSIASGIFIRPTVWPQCTNVADRQTDRHDRQDNGPVHRANRRSKKTTSKLEIKGHVSQAVHYRQDIKYAAY